MAKEKQTKVLKKGGKTMRQYNITNKLDIILTKDYSNKVKEIITACKKISNAARVYIDESKQDILVVIHKINVKESFIAENNKNNNLFFIKVSKTGVKHAYMIMKINISKLMKFSLEYNHFSPEDTIEHCNGSVFKDLNKAKDSL